MFAILAGICNAWGKNVTFTAGTAVYGSVGGSAQVELYEGSTQKASIMVTTNKLQTVSCSSGSNGFFGIGAKDPNKTKAKYTATASAGYYFIGWFTDISCTGTPTQYANPYTTPETQLASGIGNLYARFEPYDFGDAIPSVVNIENALVNHTYTGSIVVATSGATKPEHFMSPTISTISGEGTFSYVKYSWAGGELTIDYTFNGNGKIGTTMATLTVKTENKVKTKDIQLSATTVAPVVISGDAGPQLTPATPTSIVNGVITFNVSNAENKSYFIEPTFTNIQGGGSWNITSTEYSKGVYTVNYTFQADAYKIGLHSAEITLGATVGGSSISVTPTALVEIVKDYDVEVFDADGKSIFTGPWTDGLVKANANEGSTIQLARNVVGLTTKQVITNTMTLDLNGKQLSGTVAGAFVLLNNSGILTIKDSKMGGVILNEVSANAVVYALFLSNKAKVVLESGTICANNKLQYNSSNAKNVQTRAIQLEANTAFTMNSGRVEAYGTRNVYGILQSSNSANTTYVNLVGGEIYAEGPYNVYGVYAYGQLNIQDNVTINSHVTTNLVDAASSSSAAVNLNNGNVYGIYLTGSAQTICSNNYFATLTMTGGTINVTNARERAVSLNAYGIYFNAASIGIGKNTAPDGTMAHQAAAVGSIENATINVNTGTRNGFGVKVIGSYNSNTDRHSVVTIKNSIIDVKAYEYAYGVMSDVLLSGSNAACMFGDVELTNCNVTAESKNGAYAYAVYANSTFTTIYQDGPYSVYAGEYAVGAKVTINSGNYIALSKTSNAFAICSPTRARTLYGSEYSAAIDRTPAKGVESYAELIIHGGKFKGQATTSISRAVSSGGITVIDGGEFEAYSTTNNAYALYASAGKLTATGVCAVANATQNAYGIYADVYLPDGRWSCPHTGIAAPSEVILNNCNITATTRTSTTACALYVASKAKMHNWAQFETEATAWEWTEDNKNAYRQLFACTTAGRDSVGVASGARMTVNGGTYLATAATTTAYGAFLPLNAMSTNGEAVADARLNIKNAAIKAESKGSTTAYGVNVGGKTTLEGCDISAKTATTGGYGVISYDETIITDCSISSSGTATQYGIFAGVNLAYNTTNVSRAAHIVVNSGSISTFATAGNQAYAFYVNNAEHTLTQAEYDKISHSTYPKPYVGEQTAVAASAEINDGVFFASATGTDGYAIFVPADKVTTGGEAIASSLCTVNGGKFKATAIDKFADVNANGKPGSFILHGGYFVQKTNTEKYLAPEANVVELKKTLPEYAEGYRYKVTSDMTGDVVCKIGNDGYATLEEALQYVNLNSGNYTIVMVANYTLPAGEYVLPANATLLIPYKDNQVDILGPNPAWVNKYSTPTPTTPSMYRKLTFASGVNLTVKGKIEASSTLYINQNNWTGIVGGPYGWLQLNEGARVDLDPGAYLYAWGYVTGKGEITAKNGSYVYEDFQMGDWRGGSIEKDVAGSNGKGNGKGVNGKSVFLITDYYIQNIECPVTFMAGANEIAYSGCYMDPNNAGVFKVEGKSDPVKLVGTQESMFLMDPATASRDTWVRKEYNPATDRLIWTLNSDASIGSFKLKISGGSGLSKIDIDIDSKDYVLPLASNFSIIANAGDIHITNDVCFIPGTEIVIRKEASLIVPSAQNVFLYDANDWSSYGGYFHKVGYSPSWGKNPRPDASKVKLDDAKVQIEGLFDIQGQLWTTDGGANIFSTEENAGKVRFLNNAPVALGVDAGDNTLNQLIGGGPDYDPKAITSAKLKNADGSYTLTDNCMAGDIYTYMQNPADGEYRWIAVKENGCFTEMKSGDTKQYIRPSDMVAVEENANGDHAYHNEDQTRFFINTNAATTSAECVWWEADPKGMIGGVTCYMANNKNFDNYGSYFYWDDAIDYWVAKTVTITFKNYDGTILTNGTFGNSYSFNVVPQYYGANPTKANTAIYNYSWTGWDTMVGNTGEAQIGRNDPLPTATEDVTYYAHFNVAKWQYTITFKNDDGSVIESKLVNAGDVPTLSDGVEPTKTSTMSIEYVFKGWDKTPVAVTGPAEYIAQYDAKPRTYHITFYDYDATTILQQGDVTYGTMPTYDKYEPVRERTSAYSYDFDGWQPKSGDIIAKDTELPTVTEATYYVAHFTQTARRYKVTLDVAVNGATCDVPFVERAYEAALGELPEAIKKGYKFIGWFTELNGGVQVTSETSVTEDVTYYAQWVSNEVGSPLDIVDWTATSVTLNLNGIPAAGWPYTINGVEYTKDQRSADRTLTIPYEGNANDGLVITLTKNGGEVYSRHTYTIPHIITTSADLAGVQATSTVFVKDDAKLSVKDVVSVNKIVVAPGAELSVKSGVTLTVGDLLLRTTAWKAAILDNQGTINATHTYYTRIVASNSQYYQFALPLAANVKDVTLSTKSKCTYGISWLLKSYDEASRAENGEANTETLSNWKQLKADASGSATIAASVGYEMFSNTPYYREFYFPVTLPTSKTTEVPVSHTDGAAGAAHAGWNALCSPLTGKFTQTFSTPSEGIKVSELTEDGNYLQCMPTVIYPAVPFYYQAPKSGTLDFSGSQLIQKTPQRAWNTSVSEQWLRLILRDATGRILDETSIFTHPEKFSVDYESGYDVAKQSTTGTHAVLYSELACGALAFAALPDSVAESRIPLTVYAAAAKPYTFHLEDNAYLNRLNNVFLHDMETGAVIDLLASDYEVSLREGTTRGRFYITCVFRAQNVTTDIETTVQDKQTATIQKVFYNGKVYILRNGIVYDLTGRQCEMK